MRQPCAVAPASRSAAQHADSGGQQIEAEEGVRASPPSRPHQPVNVRKKITFVERRMPSTRQPDMVRKEA